MPRQQPPWGTAALVPEIARVFLVRETAMGRRITRAKAKIKAAKIPYRVPSGEDLPARVTGGSPSST
jgi:RNA polymerase sigma-70 factor (ECF subfamily)